MFKKKSNVNRQLFKKSKKHLKMKNPLENKIFRKIIQTQQKNTRNRKRLSLIDLKIFEKLVPYLEIQELMKIRFLCKVILKEKYKDLIESAIINLLRKNIDPKTQYFYMNCFINFPALKIKYKNQYKVSVILVCFGDSLQKYL